MKCLLRPRTLIPALGLVAGLFGAAQPASAQDVTITAPTLANSLEGNVGVRNLAFTVTAVNNTMAVTPAFTLRADTELIANEAEVGGLLGANDFQALVNQVLAFQALNPGQSVSQTVNVVVFGDNIFEDDETFTVDLDIVTGTPTLVTEAATGTIVNDDAVPTLTVSNPTVCEDDASALFNIALSNPTENSGTIAFTTVNGTAVAGLDFTAVNGGEALDPFETSETIVVPILNDSLVEGAQTFTLSVTPGANLAGPVAVGTATILDDETLVVDIERLPGSTIIGLDGAGEQCFLVTVTNQCGDEVPAGTEVVVTIAGETGSNRTFSVFTDSDGEAEFCYTPLFPGEDDILVSVGAFGATFTDVVTVDILVPASSTDARIQGNGFVDVDGLAAYFSLNANVKRNGRPAGNVSMTIPVARGTVNFQSTRILAVLAGNGQPAGHVGVIFGTGRIQYGRQRSTVAFRVDVLDNGTPGVPNDSFVLTLLGTDVFGNDPDVAISLGGPLKHARVRGARNDIKVDFPGINKNK